VKSNLTVCVFVNRVLNGLVLLISFVAAALPCRADDSITADQLEVVTPLYKPEFSEFEPPLGTYNYVVSWEGIPAANAQISVDQDEMYYKLSASARTYSGIDIFYKLRYRAEGLLSSYDLAPVKTTIDNQENSNKKKVEIKFLDDGGIEAIRTKEGDPDTTVLKFNPNNFMLDPFGAAFLARSLHWEKGETKTFDTFNGKSRYLISLTCEDKVSMKINGEDRDVWVISPKVSNLTSSKSNDKFRSAQIYVTADKSREIIQIVSKVFIGSVTTKLISFEPSNHPAPLTRVARHRTGLGSFFE